MDWNRIVKDLGPKLLRYFSLTFPSALAADLVQEVLIRLVQKVRSGEFDEKKGTITSYSYGIAYYVRLEALKGPYRERNFVDIQEIDLSSDESSVLEAIEEKETRHRLKEAISKLPESEQQVLALLLDKDLSLGEIGQILNMPLGTVKSHIFRAKSSLKKSLGVE